jgi:plasmid replication initiation protein
MKKDTKKKNKSIVLVKKSNNLVESRYKFDIWETRFFLSILSQIRKEDTDFQTYRIWYKDVIKTFGLKSGDSYGFLREAAKSLMKKPVNANYEENGVKRTEELHLIRKINYLTEGQERSANMDNQEYIDVVVEDEMRPFLLQLQKNFTAYDLRNVVKLGVYSVRLYELLKQYESIGSRTLKIEEMKAMFQVEEQYKLYADFYRWVIVPAEKEINEHTDLMLYGIDKMKEGRKVVALRFRFRAKTEDELHRARSNPFKNTLFDGVADAEPDTESEEVAEPAENRATLAPQSEQDKIFLELQDEVVGDFGVSPSVFLAELAGHNIEQVRQAVRVTARAKKEGRIKNLSGFFIEALRNGFTDPKEEVAKKRVKEEAQKVRAAILQEQIDVIEDEMAVIVNESIRTITTAQPEATGTAIEAMRANPLIKVYMDNKEKALNRALELDDFRTDKRLREWVKSKIMEAYPDVFQPIFVTYETKINLLKAESTK